MYLFSTEITAYSLTLYDFLKSSIFFAVLFGQIITGDVQLSDHIEHEIPIQIYSEHYHTDIGYIDGYTKNFVKVNKTYYSRKQFTFVSRPGY
jgi:ligand-binding sensor protein